MKPPAFDDDSWELYATNSDWSQSRNIAKEHPGRTPVAVVVEFKDMAEHHAFAGLKKPSDASRARG